MFAYLVFIYVCQSAIGPAAACGSVLPGSRIVGGEVTGGLRYPWFAMLRLRVPGDPPVCAGTLITPNHILTAAHCFTVKPGVPNQELFSVALGVFNRCSPFESSREIFNVTQVSVHENYSSSKKFFDIAIMTLDRAANADVACLPPPPVGLTSSQPGLIIGFGVLQQGSRNQPCRQREARVTRYTQQECAATLLPSEDTKESTVFCGGGPGIDSCQGDSGGPFLTQSNDGSYIVSGIVSYGYGCGKIGLPGIYTNVESYLDWIAEKTGRNNNPIVFFNGPPPSVINSKNNQKPPLLTFEKGSAPTLLPDSEGLTGAAPSTFENGLRILTNFRPFSSKPADHNVRIIESALPTRITFPGEHERLN